MVLNGLKIFADRWDHNRYIALTLVQTLTGERRAAAVNIEMKEIPDGVCVDPVLRITQAMAQHLMDELWSCGLRPTEGSGSAGSLAATERHLHDMRHIAFSALNQTTPTKEKP